MAIKLIEVAQRTTKHETTANIRKVSNGYKLSNLARTALGINADSKAFLAISEDKENNKLYIKAVTETENYNAVMNKNRMFTNSGICRYLNEIGENFEISKYRNAEGFHTMDNIDTTSENTNTDELNNHTEQSTYTTDNPSHRDGEITADEDVKFS